MTHNKVIYLDEQLPPINEWVLFTVVVKRAESANDELTVYNILGGLVEDGTFAFNYDRKRSIYDGDPYAIVGWTPLPQLCEEELQKHTLVWHNVLDDDANIQRHEQESN